MKDILEILENGRVDWSDEHQTTTTIVTKNERLAIAEIKKLRARIAELEAALKPFEEKSSKSLSDAEKLAATEGYELPDDQTAEDIYVWALALTWGDLRAARAARNGEKVNAKGGP